MVGHHGVEAPMLYLPLGKISILWALTNGVDLHLMPELLNDMIIMVLLLQMISPEPLIRVRGSGLSIPELMDETMIYSSKTGAHITSKRIASMAILFDRMLMLEQHACIYCTHWNSSQETVCRNTQPYSTLTHSPQTKYRQFIHPWVISMIVAGTCTCNLEIERPRGNWLFGTQTMLRTIWEWGSHCHVISFN